MARSAAERAARFKGLQVIKDAVEIDETIDDADRISIADCFGFVLIEIAPDLSSRLTRDEIQDLAEELADESIPYGISELAWTPKFEGPFIRFTVEAWEQISDKQRAKEAAEILAEDRYEAWREASHA